MRDKHYCSQGLKMYTYNGVEYNKNQYANLLSNLTGINKGTILGRISKGWSMEKIMYPDSVRKPVYQYDLEGNFIQEFSSISDAVLSIAGTKSGTTNVSRSCKDKSIKTSALGFVWRYAKDVEDKSENVNVGIQLAFNSDENMEYLRTRYSNMLYECYNPKGRYYNNPKIKVWEGWVNDWDKFYNDLLPMLLKAKEATPEYKSRKTQEKLKCNHIWFSRFDKTEGFLPHNICLITPDWCMRYRPDSIRVNLEDKTLFVPQIYDIMKEQKIGPDITEATVRQRINDKKNILSPSRMRNIKYYGRYYSSVELGEKFKLPSHRLFHYIHTRGMSVKEAIKAARNFSRTYVLYNDKKYRLFELIDYIIENHKPKIGIELIRSRLKQITKKANVLSDDDIKSIISTPKARKIYIDYKGEKRLLVDVAKEHKINYGVVHHRYERGITGDDLFLPKRELKSLEYNGKEYTISDVCKMTGKPQPTIFNWIKRGRTLAEILDVTNDEVERDRLLAEGKQKCMSCKETKSTVEFLLRKETGVLRRVCKYCMAKREGVKDIGKQRKFEQLRSQGKQPCTVCKEVKTFDEFSKSSKTKSGYFNTCKKCSHALSTSYVKKQRQSLGAFHLTQYAMRVYKLSKDEVTDEIRSKAKQAILEKQTPKYFIDSKSFITLSGFANYIEAEYGIPVTTTIKRINVGKTEEDCKMTEFEMRRQACLKWRRKKTANLNCH